MKKNESAKRYKARGFKINSLTSTLVDYSYVTWIELSEAC